MYIYIYYNYILKYIYICVYLHAKNSVLVPLEVPFFSFFSLSPGRSPKSRDWS